MNPHRSLFSQYPLVQLASAFAAGICATHWLSIRPVFLVSAAAVCSVLAFLLLKRLRLAGFVLLAAFCFAGAILAGMEKTFESALRPFVERNENRPVTLIGWLDGPPEFARDRVYLSLRVESIAQDGAEQAMSGRVWLLATARNSAVYDAYHTLQLRYGAQIRATTTLEITGNYHNPGVASLKEFLDRSGHDASGILKNPAAISRLPDKQVFPPLKWLYDWRERLQREIDTRFAPETAGVLDAALLGNRYNLSPDASERFREGGTFHVLVISGLHITFIGGIIFLLVRRLTERRLLRFLLPAAIVWAYSIAVGAEASVVRAALMFTFAGAGLVVFRQATSLNALGGAALLLLAYSPKLIFDPSFQLTFLSVLAIVVLAWPLLLKLESIGGWYPTRVNPHPPVCSRALRSFCELLFWREQRWKDELRRSSHHYRLFKAAPALWLERYHVQRCLRYAFGAVVVSAGVQVVLLPLMIIYFHRLSLASLVLNIIVSVLLAALVGVALLALLVAQLNATLAEPLFRLADAINWLMVHSVDPFSNSGLGGFRLAEYSGYGVIVYGIYYLPLLFLIVALARWQPLALRRTGSRLQRHPLSLSFAQLILIAVLVLHPFSRDRADGKLRIDFLDVGQGDAALLTMPDRTTLLIDAGGNIFDASRRIGETVVSEYLWRRGLSEIDYVLVTHADADHIDGSNDVLKNFHVRGALVGRRPAEDLEFMKFSRTLKATGTFSEVVATGDVMRFGEVELSVLWPVAGGDKSTNNDSIVVRVKFGERSMLFTGDIERATENALIASGQNLRADVVKVPHHGSKTSSTDDLVNSTKPTFAIISVGRNSMYGHPHKEVVERWQANGATVLTTGNSGTITITTDGHDLNVNKYLR